MNWQQLLSGQRLGEKKQQIEEGRSAFEQDFDRIIFSHPFRRLQDKTQVHPLPEHDFVHTRLTHSLEVSSVGRSLGKKVGQVILARNPSLAGHYTVHDFGAIVAAASLAHDIGNPPFGHSGESAIAEFFISGHGQACQDVVNALEWADLTHFEGNAQGFRILNKERYQGLRLTYATLAAFSKYPTQSTLKKRDTSRRSQKKYGFFQSERQIFKTIAEQLGLISYEEFTWCRHPLAFLVEAADDICYHLIDLEDGWRMGLVNYSDTVELFAGILGDKFNIDKLKKIDSANEQIGTLRAVAIGELVGQCIELFLDEETSLLQGVFDQALTDRIPSAETLQEVIRLSVDKIYRSRHVIETEIAGFEVLPGLLHILVEAVMEQMLHKKGLKKHAAALRLLPLETLKDIEKDQTNHYAVIMHCVDFVAGLTDRHAISLYRKIKGISLPNS